MVDEPKKDYIIETKNLRTYFKTANGYLHAVDDVNLQIERGKTIGIVGESGCGKSTLGRTILNLTPATSGSVRYNDEEIIGIGDRKSKQLRKELQIIFQDPYSSVNPRMSVSQLIREPLDVFHVGDKAQREEKVRELMDLVGLARRFELSYPHELDGGRRQRVGIARALALDPKFVVCDEPVSALDVSIQAQILNLLQDLQVSRGLTYMFITHDMSVVKHISDEICVMYCGRVVEKCKTKELFRNPSHPYTVALLSAIPVPNIHKKKEPIIIKGEVTSPINPKPCCRFAGRCEHARPECFTSEPALTDLGGGHLCACFAAAEAAGVQASVIASETL